MTSAATPTRELSVLTSGPGGASDSTVQSFLPIRLDLAQERLWKGEREVRLGNGGLRAARRALEHRGRGRSQVGMVGAAGKGAA
jgi:hypothetical protein